MKYIPVRNNDEWRTADVLKNVASISPAKSISLDDMRLRVKILDKIADLKSDATHLLLEDAEHTCLKAAMHEFPWNVANKDLLQIIDDVDEAKAPPAPVQQSKDKSKAA